MCFCWMFVGLFCGIILLVLEGVNLGRSEAIQRKKAKSEIQHIAEDAIKALQIHLNAIDKALDGDAFKNGKNEIDEKAKVTFAQIFGDAKK